MKEGKISESILKRSVLKNIQTKRPEVLFGAKVGCDFCAICGSDEVTVMSTNPVIWRGTHSELRAVCRAVNDVAVSGANPVGIEISLLLPSAYEEADLKQKMKNFETVCSDMKLQILGGHTEVTTAVNQVIATVTAIGYTSKEMVQRRKKVSPGKDIVFINPIAIEGTLLLLEEKEEELRRHFSSAFLDDILQYAGSLQGLSLYPLTSFLRDKVYVMHNAGQAGIFAGLWEIGEALGFGLEVDLKKIPIRQETVEICEIFNKNPYQLISTSALICITEDGNALVQEAERKGYPAQVAGKILAGNDRVILNGEERRFLEPPREIQRI